MKELALAYALVFMGPAITEDGNTLIAPIQCGPYGLYLCGPPPGPGGYPGIYRRPLPGADMPVPLPPPPQPPRRDNLYDEFLVFGGQQRFCIDRYGNRRC